MRLNFVDSEQRPSYRFSWRRVTFASSSRCSAIYVKRTTSIATTRYNVHLADTPHLDRHL